METIKLKILDEAGHTLMTFWIHGAEKIIRAKHKLSNYG